MKKKTYLFALMTMALTLGSCSDNENVTFPDFSRHFFTL